MRVSRPLETPTRVPPLPGRDLAFIRSVDELSTYSYAFIAKAMEKLPDDVSLNYYTAEITDDKLAVRLFGGLRLGVDSHYLRVFMPSLYIAEGHAPLQADHR